MNLYAVVADLSAMFVGVIQFSSQSTSLMVDEGVGIASLSVIRNPCSYGGVSVLYSVAAGKESVVTHLNVYIYR